MLLSSRLMMSQVEGDSAVDLVSFNIASGGTTIHIYDSVWTGGGTIYYWVENTSAPGSDAFGDTGGDPSPKDDVQVSSLVAGRDYLLHWSSIDGFGWTSTGVAWTQPGKRDPAYTEDWPP